MCTLFKSMTFEFLRDDFLLDSLFSLWCSFVTPVPDEGMIFDASSRPVENYQKTG